MVPEVVERDVAAGGGRVLRAYDTGSARGTAGLAVVWHHGSPQTGRLPDPLRAAAAERGIRLLSYGRPSYGGSSPDPGRTVGDAAAADVVAVLDAFRVDRAAAVGASGGGPHALAGAALHPERVPAVVSLAGPAPPNNDFDWSAGKNGLRVAAQGRAARAAHAESEEFDATSFTAADYAALEGSWAWLGEDAGRGGRESPDGLIDDDVALAHPWGFDLEQVEVPVLLVHGQDDRVIPLPHAEWLAVHLLRARLWVFPQDGHISVLERIPVALDWLLAQEL